MSAITIIVFIACSCSITEKSSIPCPDISVREPRAKKLKIRPINVNIHSYSKIKSKKSDYNKDIAILEKGKAMYLDIKLSDHGTNEPVLATIGTSIEKVNSRSKATFEEVVKKNYFENQDTIIQKCDTLFYRDGTKKLGKVVEVGIDEIKYRHCNFNDGPLNVVRKSDISKIKFNNGIEEVFKEIKEKKMDENQSNLKYNSAGVMSFIFSITSLFIFGIIFGVTGIVLGFIGLSKISKYPDVYKGKGLSVAGIMIGVISIVLLLMFI